MTQKTILIVDDDFHICKVLSLKLKNANFEVVTAANGLEALDALQNTTPSLMITDYSMPEMTGLELVGQVREHENLRDIPIIMLTARGQTVEEAEGDKPKINALMSKPFSPREVLQKVEELLGVKV
ncbi:MAG: response regulator [Planctomycetota bacterium]|jgi:chemosensory pili system protein ChpA (sensor histidine kinase/response regulator)